MVDKYAPRNSKGWRIPYSLWQTLNERKKPRQSLAGVVEEILDELEQMRKIHDPLIDRISKLQNVVDYYEQQGITEDILKRLAQCRHPTQTCGGVVLELLEIAKKVEKSGLSIYLDKRDESDN